MKPYHVRSVSRRNQICLPKEQLEVIGAKANASFKVRVIKSRKQIILEYLGG